MMMFSRNIRKVRWLAGEVELSVTDTVSGRHWTYRNPRGVPFPPVQDTAALGPCP